MDEPRPYKGFGVGGGLYRRFGLKALLEEKRGFI
jgi:hypothetical protein